MVFWSRFASEYKKEWAPIRPLLRRSRPRSPDPTPSSASVDLIGSWASRSRNPPDIRPRGRGRCSERRPCEGAVPPGNGWPWGRWGSLCDWKGSGCCRSDCPSGGGRGPTGSRFPWCPGCKADWDHWKVKFMLVPQLLITCICHAPSAVEA